MSATQLRRPLDDSDSDGEPSAQVPQKRAKTAPATDMLGLFASLGLPIATALTKSYTHFSAHTPDTTGYVLGVDEAGRGPVLGPMVYATCFCPESFYPTLSSLGFADSKQLSEEQRDKLFAELQLHPQAGWSIRCLSPQDISQSMLRRSKYNLNSMAHDATIHLIRETLERGIQLRKVFIDTVGPPLTYQKRLQELFPGVEITVAKKADSLYPIVSAASVCAKVTRDAHLSNWVFAEGPQSTNYGSGYPGDPSTVRWLKESVDHVFGYPGIIRFSWSTCVKLLEDSAAKVVWPDDEGQSNAKLLTSRLFNTKEPTGQRSKFFARRRPITLATSL
ncbi:hypothetical protein IWW39_005256 [Coemansia spiralis]|uniref:Ribonuclease n=1 Tax=Coemansia spiralis TaxID=417178 RepID=A0A9W8L2L1_9FUNG|nr:hypothetical protein IWW39_005256 [Coemansia spiralis]